MTFVATQNGEYIDADVSLELPYQAGLLMTKENMANVDNLANDMHQRVLAEVCENINNGFISLQIKEKERRLFLTKMHVCGNMTIETIKKGY